MARPRLSQPSELEIDILQVLWRLGPSTARQVCDALPRGHERSISSVHIALRAMAEKKYVVEDRRKKSDGGLLYTAVLTKEGAGGRLFKILGKIFGGTKPALQRLLTVDDLSERDLDELSEIIRRKKDKK